MVRTTVIATCLLLFAGGSVGGAAGARSEEAKLRVVALQPVKLAGSGFAADELVRVSVTSELTTARRAVRASSRGAFVVYFPTVSYDRCNGGLTAVARGARGSFATAKVLPLPLCPPRLRDPE